MKALIHLQKKNNIAFKNRRMSSTDEEEESDAPEEILSSYSSGTSWVQETTPSTEDHSSFSDHSEELDYDEETNLYSVKDVPDEVWEEHYEYKQASSQ